MKASRFRKKYCTSLQRKSAIGRKIIPEVPASKFSKLVELSRAHTTIQVTLVNNKDKWSKLPTEMQPTLTHMIKLLHSAAPTHYLQVKHRKKATMGYPRKRGSSFRLTETRTETEGLVTKKM